MNFSQILLRCPMTKEQFDAKLREQIAKGEITPEEAAIEYDFFVNGCDSDQNIYGW